MSCFVKSASCLLFLSLYLQQTFSFDVEGFCRNRCLHGRGGILCKCSAIHFAGKRSHPHPGANGYSTDQDLGSVQSLTNIIKNAYAQENPEPPRDMYRLHDISQHVKVLQPTDLLGWSGKSHLEAPLTGRRRVADYKDRNSLTGGEQVLPLARDDLGSRQTEVDSETKLKLLRLQHLLKEALDGSIDLPVETTKVGDVPSRTSQ
ncbi:uncharacterized protein LOC131949768 [Physella acuta]|uniref:uncharacterized protein LOC131949768 n=1 Tax=Physella acuta TaxID=109671 RepID=UPI0027DD6070|nr:uncharacterized protein LOC131949768 [Physella acuta]